MRAKIGEVIEAAQLLCDHDRRVLLRWLVAQRYNAFTPQPCQEWTRRLMREHLEFLLAWMAQRVPHAGKAHHLDEPARYDAVLEQVAKLSVDEQRSLVRLLVHHWQLLHGYDANADLRLQGLLLVMLDAERQMAANASGWLAGGGTATVAPGGSYKRRRRSG